VAGTDRIQQELIKHRRNELLNRMYEPGRQIWGEEGIVAFFTCQWDE